MKLNFIFSLIASAAIFLLICLNAVGGYSTNITINQKNTGNVLKDSDFSSTSVNNALTQYSTITDDLKMEEYQPSSTTNQIFSQPKYLIKKGLPSGSIFLDREVETAGSLPQVNFQWLRELDELAAAYMELQFEEMTAEIKGTGCNISPRDPLSYVIKGNFTNLHFFAVSRDNNEIVVFMSKAVNYNNSLDNIIADYLNNIRADGMVEGGRFIFPKLFTITINANTRQDVTIDLMYSWYKETYEDVNDGVNHNISQSSGNIKNSEIRIDKLYLVQLGNITAKYNLESIALSMNDNDEKYHSIISSAESVSSVYGENMKVIAFDLRKV